MPADEELEQMPGEEEAAVEGAEDQTPEDDLKERLKKDIHVEIAEAGVLRKALTITVPREPLQKELDKDYQELITEAVVPGFRRGRAPRRLVEKRFGNEIGEQVLTRLVSNAFLAATEKEDLKVIGDPLFRVAVKERKAADSEATEKLVDLREALANLKLPDEGDFSFKCEIEVKPEFELPAYEQIPIKKHLFAVTDEDVTAEINRMLANQANWVPVLEGGVQTDNLLVCDVRMLVEDREVKKIDNITLAARSQVIEHMTFENFGEVVAGAKVGDVRTLSGTLPEDHELADSRGKPALLEMKINEIKRIEYPPLDQAFLGSLGFDTEADYRAWIKLQMQAEVDQRVVADQRNQVRQYLLDNTKLDLPEGLSLRQTARVVTRMIVDMQRRGVPDEVLSKHADELRTTARERATTDLKLTFILDQIAEKLEVDVTEEEVNSAIAEMARSYNRRFDRVRDDLARSGGLESLYTNLRDEKCIDALLAKAQITEAEEERPTPDSGKPVTAAAESPKSATPENEPAADEPAKPRPKRTPPPKKSDA